MAQKRTRKEGGSKLRNLEWMYFLNVSQVISLKKLTVLSVKITILISWSPIWIPLILLSALMKLASTSATILYNSMESRHPWCTNIRIKESGRRPFILILNLILVEATLVMWMNLSPYPNLCKAEKIKSTPRILQKDFYSVWLINQCIVKLYF